MLFQMRLILTGQRPLLLVRRNEHLFVRKKEWCWGADGIHLTPRVLFGDSTSFDIVDNSCCRNLVRQNSCKANRVTSFFWIQRAPTLHFIVRLSYAVWWLLVRHNCGPAACFAAALDCACQVLIHTGKVVGVNSHFVASCLIFPQLAQVLYLLLHTGSMCPLPLLVSLPGLVVGTGAFAWTMTGRSSERFPPKVLAPDCRALQKLLMPDCR